MVFAAGGASSILRQLTGYVLLALIVATASATLVASLADAFTASPTLMKIFVDPCLFVLSFLTQRLVIFKKPG